MDSEKLLAEIAKSSQKLGRAVDVLIQVNISKDQNKSGIEASELSAILNDIAVYRGVRICGLMTILRDGLTKDKAQFFYEQLAELAQSMSGQLGERHLSMGMSGDFDSAVRAGATIVRVGSAIFGPRI